MEVNDLRQFHSNHYNAEKICIAIAGNLSNDVYKIFEESDLSEISKRPIYKKQSIENLQENKTNLQIRKGRELIKFDNLEFSRIFMAWFIPKISDQKIIIGLEILASSSVGRNSRLVKILKENNNLVESVYADVNLGVWGIIYNRSKL